MICGIEGQPRAPVEWKLDRVIRIPLTLQGVGVCERPLVRVCTGWGQGLDVGSQDMGAAVGGLGGYLDDDEDNDSADEDAEPRDAVDGRVAEHL
eukprot:2350062-Rhodomonas_salina.1